MTGTVPIPDNTEPPEKSLRDERSEEERRWRASVENPASLARNRRWLLLLLGIWSVLIIGWIALVLCGVDTFRWTTVAVWAIGLINIGIGIINNRRIRAGKKPF